MSTTSTGIDPATLVGPVEQVAPRLLQQLLVRDDGRVGRIVEVEAYGGSDDPASHAARGRRPRNATMFGRAGLLYVYRSYGLHWCANVVVGAEGDPAAVLLRALEPLGGVDLMERRRSGRRRAEWCNGPGKLCAAMDITGDHDGNDLLDPAAPIRLCTDGTTPPEHPAVSARVGITRAAERKWRFSMPGSTWVSRGRPSHGG